jgi:uncharacterized protein YbaR (Trm112 family)
MFKLKACPRCRGDLREDRDKYGKYSICMQCGYHEIDTEDEVPPTLPLVSRRGRPRKSLAAMA